MLALVEWLSTSQFPFPQILSQSENRTVIAAWQQRVASSEDGAGARTSQWTCNPRKIR